MTSLLTAITAVQAQAQFVPTGAASFYVGAEGGWTSLASAEARIPEKEGPQNWVEGSNAGARAGFEWAMWRLEGEFRYQHSNVSTIALHPARGDRAAYAFLLNLIRDLDIGWPLSPHFGAGFGAVALHDDVRVPAIGIGQATDRSDWEFGYQGIAGLRYDLSPALAFDLDYRYLATTGAHFVTRAGLIIDGTGVGNLKETSSYHAHSVVASLTLRFGPPLTPQE